MAIEVRVSAADLARMSVTLDDFAKRQLPFATALALTRTAQTGRDDLRKAMAAAFDRPTRWTLNSLYVEPATKAKLAANVHFKDEAPKGVPAGRYLRPEILGGPRKTKTHERRLAQFGIVPPGYYLVPTKHADLDAHGNMSAGQIKKILSWLNAAEPTAGVIANARGRVGRGARRAETYFAVVPGRPQGRGGESGGLPPAIYKATGSGQARVIVPVAVIVSKPPAYTARFDFDGIAMASFDRTLPGELGKAIERALRTARR